MKLATIKRFQNSLIISISILVIGFIIFYNIKPIANDANSGTTKIALPKSQTSNAEDQKVVVPRPAAKEFNVNSVIIDENDEFTSSVTSLDVSKEVREKLQISSEEADLIRSALLEVVSAVMDSQNGNRIDASPPNQEEPNTDRYSLKPLSPSESALLESQFQTKLDGILGAGRSEILGGLIKQQVKQHLLLLDFGRLGAQFKFDRPAAGGEFFVDVYTIKDGLQVGGGGMLWSKIPEPWSKLFSEAGNGQ